ncbi:MAG: CDP-glycerol glycerophosphotransferase family protein [Actinomycetes bacterium]
MTETSPDVTVVVIGYNDAARIARAVESVRRQTLRNLEIVVVDDASTDETAEVVGRIAAKDPRIRYVRLASNSGGCSAPRNEGVALARAPWVMFCDSDDEYERHACKNLLLAAERLDADVVCGAAERVDTRTGRTRRWKPELHEQEVVADGLAEYPDLLADTISVNKIYRHQLLLDNEIRFPEGLLFEDQLFTLEAMASARRLASIPETVYRWYVDELSDEPSITQRRKEAANVESRIEINRRIDAYLAVDGREAIREIKELKFLRHDLYLYLAVMLDVDDETATALMERLRPYVESVNLAPAWQLRTGLRVAIYHLLVGDLAGVRSAMRLVKWASVVDASIIADGDREFWACEHLGSDVAPGGFATREWLDVTELGLLKVPFSQRRFLHHVDEVTVSDEKVVATGTSVDYDGSLATSEALELRFIIGRSRLVASVPVNWIDGPGPRRRWRAEGALANLRDRPLAVDDHGTIAMAVPKGVICNVTGVRADRRLALRGHTQLTGIDSSAEPDILEIQSAPNAGVGWLAVQSAEHLAAVAGQQRGSRLPGLSSVSRRWSEFSAKAVAPALARVTAALPAGDLVLFDTSSGRSASDSVRALSAYLNAMRPDVAQAWVHHERPDRVPSYCAPVDRLSREHRLAAARARWLVDDGTAPVGLRTRPDAQVVLISDGVPIVRAGLDDPDILGDSAARRDIARRAGRWTTAVVPSPFAAEVLRRAYDFGGDVVEAGILRADHVVETRREPARSAARAALDLDLDRPVIVYAPALRSPGTVPSASLIDLRAWSSALGSRAYLVIAADPRQPIEDNTSLRHAVRVLTAAERLNDFLPACDLLVSDYSSVIGDAALAGIPTIVFQPDREVFVHRSHGLYVDPAAFAPSAVTTDALIARVGEYLADPERWRRENAEHLLGFAVGHCGPADGASLRRAVDALWPLTDGRAT